MKMQRREKILAYSAAGLLVVTVGWYLLMGGDTRSDAQLENERTQLTADRNTKRELVAADERDARRLKEWRRRALPSDHTSARSLYQDWLHGLAKRFHFEQLGIDPREVVWRTGTPPREMFTRMSFTVHGHVTLADLTQFLYEFYATGHFHQIRQMDMKPVPLEHAGKLEVTLGIEAVSLPNADRADQLSKEPGHGLRFAKSENYRDPIVKRNLFAPYTPPPPVGPHVATTIKKPEGSVDTAKYAYVTGFTDVDGLRQVWIDDRIAGKVWKLKEGEDFSVGKLRGTVRTIATSREVTLDFDGHRRRLRDGENLRGGVEVDGHAKN